MSITAQNILTGVQKTQLNDVDGVTWTNEILLSALNQAILLLILVRPDVTALVAEYTCVAGTRQTLPIDATRLLKVVRNIKVDGAYGRAIRLVNQHDLDSIDPDWHGATPTAIIKEYMFDDRAPKWFFTYPPAIAGTKLEIEYARQPETITDLSQVLPVDAVYYQPLQEFILYKLLSGEGGQSQGQGMQHYNTAMQLLGAKNALDKFSAPVTKMNPATGVA